MTARLEACFFAAVGSDGRWTRLSRVLEWTARQQCPDWQINVECFDPAPAPSRMGIRAYESNTQKLDRWDAIVQASVDGDRLLLIDADTMILRPLDDIWERSFDLAYTVKRSNFPLNGGVVFLRISERVKAFVSAWAAENRRLLAESDQTAPWRYRFGGVNQAALQVAFEAASALSVELLELPCQEWNCEDSTWATFDPAVTRILHIKSALRQACLTAFPDPGLQSLREIWRAAERAAHGAQEKVS